MAKEPRVKLLSNELERQLRDLLKWRKSFTVTGAASFSNTPTACSIAISQAEKQAKARRATESFWAKITGSLTMSGADNRWQYAWSEQVRTATGWTTPTGGRSGTTEEDFALNSAEAFNDATGVQGHGVDIDGADYPAGFEMQPIQGDRVVRMWQETATDGSVAFSFEATNADDGTCEAP